MQRRSVVIVLLVGLLTGSALNAAVVAAPSATLAAYNLKVRNEFSPNGDRVMDTLRVRYTVPVPTRPRLEIRGAASSAKLVRTVDLGWHRPGTYSWRWDGRDNRGRRLGQGPYSVSLRRPNGSPVAIDYVTIDTSYKATLTTPSYAATDGATPRVFPRSTDVRDAIEVTAWSPEPLQRVKSMHLVIRNRAGKVVRKADVNRPWVDDNNGQIRGHGRMVRWTARRSNKPLPPGRYTADVTGRDKAGNRVRAKAMKIWVSADKLAWKETTTTIPASEHRFGPCTYNQANGCGESPPCGEVLPSDLFAGGLSYRSRLCPDPDPYEIDRQAIASSDHLLEVPEATGVRGVAAVRVAFRGAPTIAGAPDVGTLHVWGTTSTTTVSGTSGQSEWVTDPRWGDGDNGMPSNGDARREPGAVWSFLTRGTDSVDVAAFTVDIRYLAIKR